jgi:hypothetical protein
MFALPSHTNGALANCTLGEMVQALADVYGRIRVGRSGEPLEFAVGAGIDVLSNPVVELRFSEA